MQQATAMTPRKVAIFDFDGTIVDGQSGALFTTYLLRHGIMRLPRALHLAGGACATSCTCRIARARLA